MAVISVLSVKNLTGKAKERVDAGDEVMMVKSYSKKSVLNNLFCVCLNAQTSSDEHKFNK